MKGDVFVPPAVPELKPPLLVVDVLLAVCVNVCEEVANVAVT